MEKQPLPASIAEARRAGAAFTLTEAILAAALVPE